MPDVIREVHAGDSVVRLLRYAADESQALHWHAESFITLVLRGGLSETSDRGTEQASALSVVFKPARVGHADRVGEHGATTIQIALGGRDEALVHATGPGLRTWRWEHATSPARLMLELAGCLSMGSRRRAEGDTRRVFHSLLPALAAYRTPDRPAPRPWLAAATARIAADRAGIREVAAGARVHPVYFARAFRRCFGETPVGYRRRHRFREAAALLTDTREPLADVAQCAGFSDQAHMTRDLVRHMGLTPRALRQLANPL